MTVEEVLALLRSSEGPSRHLDDAVAEIVGWSRRFEIHVDPKTKIAKKMQKKVWLVPSGEEEKPVPKYSANAQAAFEMLQAIDKDAFCAVTITSGIAQAQILGEGVQAAPNVAMAICMVALAHLQQEHL